MNPTQKYAFLKPMSRPSKQQGMTLVELMVAMTISMFMLIAISLVYMSSKTGFVYANNTTQMSEDAAFAVDTISRDIRMAGYAGCAGSVISRDNGPDGLAYTADDVIDDPSLLATSKSTPNLFNVATWPTTSELKDRPNLFKPALTATAGNAVFSAANAVYGISSGTGGDSDRLLLHPSTPTTYSVSSTSPMLYVAGGSEQALQITNTLGVAKGSTTLTVSTSDPYNWSNNFGSSKTMLMVIADCKGSEVFRANTMTKSTGTITAATGFVNDYASDALVMPLVASTYFLATRTNATTPSLYRRYFNGVEDPTSNQTSVVIEELVPNVEALSFQYGENTTLLPAGTGVPTYQVDAYRSNASDVVNWERVVSIRMGLIMVSAQAGQSGSATASSLELLGTAYTPASTTDGRLRRAYSTTVSIRNRMGL